MRLKPLAWSILLALSSAAALAEGETPAAASSTPNMGPIEIELPAGYEEEMSKSGTSQKGLQVLEAQEVKAEYEERDEKGRSDVYRKNVSNVYAGKEELERYKGTSVSDVFSGLNGVYSGDARNSGALDPNIRGIQGEGRIPVTVDGTEQAMSVWQGSGGISNRNYVDPNMIGSISVEKGPSLSEGVTTGIGGSVQIKTLDVDDIVKPGQPWGIEIKTETASNSVSPSDSGKGMFGQDYHDIPGAYSSYDGIVSSALANGGGRTTPRKGSGGTDFNFDDNAFRIAAGTRQEDFDLLAAYSYRHKGNYYSGKGGSQRYETEDWLDKAKAESDNSVPGAGTSYVAQLYHPGYEVTNTSSDIRTTLLKGTWYLPDQQSLKLSYMHTDMEYGESSPFVNSLTVYQGLDGTQNVGIQYPYSEVKQDTWSLSYAWNPEDNDLINLKAGIWQTHNDSKRYQTGDWIFGVTATGMGWDQAWDDWTRCYYSGDANACASAPAKPVAQENSDGRFTVFARSLQVSRHDRWGVNVTNRMELSDTFNVTLASDFSHEKLDENYASPQMIGSEIVYATSHYGPRSGKRQQYNFSFNNEWTALPWLVVNAGARYSDYNSFDDGLAKHREDKDSNWEVGPTTTGARFSYQRLMSDEEAAELEGEIRSEVESWGLPTEDAESLIASELDSRRVNGFYYTKEAFTAAYDGFKIDRSTNQFLNGTIDLNETVANAQGTTETAKRYIADGSFAPISTAPTEAEKYAKPEKRRDHAWTPMAGLTFLLTDNARVYVRYSEMVRFPTLYEDTQAGTAFGRSSTAAMDPEHAYNWEVGYVHDFRSFVPEWRHADFRINYYKNEIHDFIDRDRMYNIVQFDKKTYSGIELQTRTDTGRYFSNFGVSYRLEQKLCDKDYAATLDPYDNNAIASCVTGGFPQTMARTSLQPKYSINLDGGVRLFDEKLELGGRMVYHSSAENKEEAKWIANGNLGADGFGRPYQWHPIWVFDAFASYQITENLDVDFGVNNLTNRYYIDPLARAMMPAPGRTMKLGLTARF